MTKEMRFLKRLLIIVLLFLAVYIVAAFVAWCITGNEPAVLTASVCSCVVIELVVAGYIEIQKKRADKKYETKEDVANTVPSDDETDEIKTITRGE